MISCPPFASVDLPARLNPTRPSVFSDIHPGLDPVCAKLLPEAAEQSNRLIGNLALYQNILEPTKGSSSEIGGTKNTPAARTVRSLVIPGS
jgi:hypothetical protein